MDRREWKRRRKGERVGGEKPEMESEVCSRGHHLCRSPWPDTCLPARPLLPPSLLTGTEFRVSAHECMLDLNPDIVVLCVGVSSYSVNVKGHALRHNGSDFLVVQPHFFLSFCSLTSHFSFVRHPVITSFRVFAFAFDAAEFIRKTNFPSGKLEVSPHIIITLPFFFFFF